MIPRHPVTGVIIDPSTGTPLAGASLVLTPCVSLLRVEELGIPITVEAIADENGRVGSGKTSWRPATQRRSVLVAGSCLTVVRSAGMAYIRTRTAMP